MLSSMASDCKTLSDANRNLLVRVKLPVEKLSSSVWFDEWQSKDGGECLACKLVLK